MIWRNNGFASNWPRESERHTFPSQSIEWSKAKSVKSEAKLRVWRVKSEEQKEERQSKAEESEARQRHQQIGCFSIGWCKKLKLNYIKQPIIGRKISQAVNENSKYNQENCLKGREGELPSYHWLVEKVTWVFWTNHITK